MAITRASKSTTTCRPRTEKAISPSSSAHCSSMASQRGLKRAISTFSNEPDCSKPTKPAKKAKLSMATKTVTQQQSPLLALAAEIRLLIYDHLLDFTGVVVIYAQHELSKEVNKDSIALLHVCQLIREEVQALFYQNQTFRFCSMPAIDKFLDKIGNIFASNIRNVQITPWLGIRQDFLTNLPRIFKCLEGVERLTILNADKRYVTVENDGYAIVMPTATTSWLQPLPLRLRLAKASISDNTLSILRVSGRLATGRLYYFYETKQPELQFVPRDVLFENAKTIGSTFVIEDTTIVELEVPDLTLVETDSIDHEQTGEHNDTFKSQYLA